MLWSLNLDEVAFWNISKNSQDYTCGGVSFVINLQDEKICQILQNSTCTRVSFLINLQAGGITSKPLR